jgi:hypothetical protein
MGSDNRHGAAGDIVIDCAEVVIIPVLVPTVLMPYLAPSAIVSSSAPNARRTFFKAARMPDRQKASALTGVLTLKERHGHDLEIKNQTPIFHVPDVVINPLG